MRWRRPACGQCLKRSNPCDYMPQSKRRGTVRPRKGDESESESGGDRSGEADEPPLSPEVPSQPLSRRSSNVERGTTRDGFAPPMLTSERRDIPLLVPASRLVPGELPVGWVEGVAIMVAVLIVVSISVPGH